MREYEGRDYALDYIDAPGKAIGQTESANIVNIYYGLDEIGNPGMPDKYEATIIYQIEGGTWTDETVADVSADRTEYVPMSEWSHDDQTWVKIPGEVKPTNVPDGTRKDDNVDSGTWGQGEVDGTTNSANVNAPKDQVLAAAKTYVFKLTFEPLEADIEVPVNDGTVGANDRTWVYDGSAHSVTASVTKAPENAKYELFYSTDGGNTWVNEPPA